MSDNKDDLEQSNIAMEDDVNVGDEFLFQKPSSSLKKYLTFAEEWGVTQHAIEQAWSQHIEHTFREEHKNVLLYLFCLSKGIAEDRLRVLFFEASQKTKRKIVTPFIYHRSIFCQSDGSEKPILVKRQEAEKLSFTDWWIAGTDPIALEMQATLRELLQPSCRTTEIPHEISFAAFTRSHPEWEEGKSFVFFRDHPVVRGKPGVLIQRKQLSGNCYIHGPVIFRHYKACLTNPDVLPIPAIDIRKFILCNLPIERLATLITHVGGGSSREIAQWLLGDSHGMFNVSNINDICAHLGTHGPSLVAGFNIEEKFHGDQWSFRGCFSSRSTGTHSMVCIGYRVVPPVKHGDKATIFLLLQNWWSNKQFLECDEEYLEASGAQISFCRKSHVNISTDFRCSTTTAEYAEAGADAEDLAPEEFRRW